MYTPLISPTQRPPSYHSKPDNSPPISSKTIFQSESISSCISNCLNSLKKNLCCCRREKKDHSYTLSIVSNQSLNSLKIEYFQLYQLFKVLVVDSFDEVGVLSEQQNFLNTYDQIDQIIELQKINTIPLIHFMINIIKSEFSDWHNLKNMSVESQLEKVKIKIDNYVCIGKIIVNLINSNDVSLRELQQISLVSDSDFLSNNISKNKFRLSPNFIEFTQKIHPFLKGEIIIHGREDLRQLFETILLNYLVYLNSNSVHGSKEGLTCPSEYGLQAQKLLFKTRTLFKTVDPNTSLHLIEKKNIRIIFRRDSLNAKSITSFFKLALDHDRIKDRTIFEKIVWDISLLLKIESFFTPTAFNYVNLQHKNLNGTIQPWSGNTLRFHLERKQSLPTIRNTNETCLIAAILGMYDVHTDNILIDCNNQFKFFDNSRSLPLSNGAIVWPENYTFPTFKNALLVFDSSHKPIEDVSRERLLTMVNTVLSNLKSLPAYFNQKHIRGVIDKLPKNWFDTTLALKALLERTILIKQALQNKEIKSIADICLVSQPNLKAYLILQLIQKESNLLYTNLSISDIEDKARLLFLDIEMHNFKECLQTCVKRQFYPNKIFKWCDDKSLSYLEIAKLIFTQQRPNKAVYSPAEMTKQVKIILDSIEKSSKHDYKDAVIDSIFE